MPLSNDDGFEVVNNKKKSKGKPLHGNNSALKDYLVHTPNCGDKETIKRRIEEAKEELTSSDFYESVSASLREALLVLGQPSVNSIICLGLGKIGECVISRYQFALLLCLKDIYQTEVEVFDPIFSSTEKSIVEYFGCVILKENAEGKFKIPAKCTTIFYLPHCPKQLTNNLLWANWGLELSNCILMANSFSTIIENSPKRILKDQAHYILKVFPHVLELAIINNFKFFEVFSDTAIHVFPMDKLVLLSDEFWESPVEPKYSEDTLEIITNKLQLLEVNKN